MLSVRATFVPVWRDQQARRSTFTTLEIISSQDESARNIGIKAKGVEDEGGEKEDRDEKEDGDEEVSGREGDEEVGEGEEGGPNEHVADEAPYFYFDFVVDGSVGRLEFGYDQDVPSGEA